MGMKPIGGETGSGTIRFTDGREESVSYDITKWQETVRDSTGGGDIAGMTKATGKIKIVIDPGEISSWAFVLPNPESKATLVLEDGREVAILIPVPVPKGVDLDIVFSGAIRSPEPGSE